MGGERSKLPELLQAAGVAPADVDTVIVTHGHMDHVGGILDAAGGAIVANIGHGRREVAEVVAQELAELTYVPPSFPTESRARLAVSAPPNRLRPPSRTRPT